MPHKAGVELGKVPKSPLVLAGSLFVKELLDEKL